jgi:hypothetical protein
MKRWHALVPRSVLYVWMSVEVLFVCALHQAWADLEPEGLLPPRSSRGYPQDVIQAQDKMASSSPVYEGPT